jgi:hypothetical protein
MSAAASGVGRSIGFSLSIMLGVACIEEFDMMLGVACIEELGSLSEGAWIELERASKGFSSFCGANS